VYLDRDVPWHYPWVYFLATVPIGLHVLGGIGVRAAWKQRREAAFPLVVAGVVAGWLVVFSTRAPVYDCERLFLLVFPLWALLVGRGFQEAWSRLGGRARRAALVGLLLVQGYGVYALHPFGLSYYNALVAGLPGAERLGLELTYWGDAVDGPLLDALARRAATGQSVALVPTLHSLQPASLMTEKLFARKVTLGSEQAAGGADWLLVYRRTAYWPEGFSAELARCRLVRLQRRQGVWLAGLWLRPGVRFAARTELRDRGNRRGGVDLAGPINTIVSE
jgi:hypothetical protein